MMYKLIKCIIIGCSIFQIGYQYGVWLFMWTLEVSEYQETSMCHHH